MRSKRFEVMGKELVVIAVPGHIPGKTSIRHITWFTDECLMVDLDFKPAEAQKYLQSFGHETAEEVLNDLTILHYEGQPEGSRKIPNHEKLRPVSSEDIHNITDEMLDKAIDLSIEANQRANTPPPGWRSKG